MLAFWSKERPIQPPDAPAALLLGFGGAGEKEEGDSLAQPLPLMPGSDGPYERCAPARGVHKLREALNIRGGALGAPWGQSLLAYLLSKQAFICLALPFQPNAEASATRGLILLKPRRQSGQHPQLPGFSRHFLLLN